MTVTEQNGTGTTIVTPPSVTNDKKPCNCQKVKKIALIAGAALVVIGGVVFIFRKRLFNKVAQQ